MPLNGYIILARSRALLMKTMLAAVSILAGLALYLLSGSESRDIYPSLEGSFTEGGLAQELGNAELAVELDYDGVESVREVAHVRTPVTDSANEAPVTLPKDHAERVMLQDIRDELEGLEEMFKAEHARIWGLIDWDLAEVYPDKASIPRMSPEEGILFIRRKAGGRGEFLVKRWPRKDDDLLSGILDRRSDLQRHPLMMKRREEFSAAIQALR